MFDPKQNVNKEIYTITAVQASTIKWVLGGHVPGPAS